MAYKAPYQNFETSWTKTVNWAHAQGIPQSSWYPVYQMDSKRLLTPGDTQMSEAERTRAILAAYNPNNVTPLPTDKPQGGIGGFFGNLEHDASNIFTGLQPTHLVTSIFDSVKNTFEHPAWLLDPTKNTLMQMVPGISLLGEYEQGGWKNVFSHPLLTFLNVLGVASAGTSLVARTALGDTLAGAIGVGSREALAKMGPIKIAAKVLGNVPTKTEGLVKDQVTGLPVYKNLTISQKLTNWANVKGVGGQIADLSALVHSGAQTASAKLEQLVKEGTAANAQMADKTLTVDDHLSQLMHVPAGTELDYVHAAFNLAVFSGKSWSELRAMDDIPVEIKNAMVHYEKAESWIEEMGLASGKLTKVRLPDGTYAVYTAAESNIINRAEDAANAAADKVDKLSGHADHLADEIQANDNVAKPAFAQLSSVAGQVRSAIKRTLTEAETSPEMANRLRGTLPKDQQWERLNINQANVAKLLGTEKVSLTQARMVNEVFSSGGLIDQIAEAYQREDFGAFRDLSLKLKKKLNSTQLNPMKDPLNIGIKGQPGSPAMQQVRTVAENLYTYGKARKTAEDKLTKATSGAALKNAVKEYKRTERAYQKTVWSHPSAAWQPMMVKLTNDKIAADERSHTALEAALEGVKESKQFNEKALKEFRDDPGRLVDLLQTYITAGHTSPFGATLDKSLIAEMKASAQHEIESLRAQGHTPHYVPSFSSRDSLGSYDPSELGQIHLDPTRYMTPDSVRQRMMDQSNTMYDIWAGQTRAMAQQIQSDSVQSLIDDVLIPTHGYKQSDLMQMVEREDPTFGVEKGLATSQAYLAHLLEDKYDLTRFDPSSYGLASSRHITGEDTIWMPKPIVSGLRDIVTRGQLEKTGAISGATNIFRNAVLGYSPRFVAHILFGGSFLVALREPASFLRMGEAYKMLKDPEFRAAIHTRSTQVGKDDPVAFGVRAFHAETGKTMGRLWAQEMMDKLGLDPSKMTSWLKVIPQMTFKLTNTITDMQRAQVVLSGMSRARRKGYVLDEAGNKLEATPERLMEEGVRTANKVMGDLSHMTPLERNVITTVIPFYGWTKHILGYVASYPVDHPYRAMFLANLANMNSDEVSRGLYTRIQNLFFLGSPDQQGNVSAVDVRALNPLRDVANYATIGGLISMLNPVISAPFAMVDPEAVFGSNVLYPNITYNALYGTKTAAPAGNALTVAEQFVPELTSIDAALGISAQYRGLAKSNPNSFAKAIFGALNIPFAQVQHLNLKQIAATQEIDRYQQASQAAKQAFQSGDFGALAGYGDVPNPLQADYNISPAALQALYNSTLASAGGLPPSEVLPSLPAPAGL